MLLCRFFFIKLYCIYDVIQVDKVEVTNSLTFFAKTKLSPISIINQGHCITLSI